ncbi:hypothetical protein UA44_07385 [Klebsiella aerogenes]|nr:hypothetical protein UA44_07385 [Klebsiella aerogenes]
MGLTNVEVMVPFVRTVAQAKAVVEELERQGLKRGENGLKIIMMCESRRTRCWRSSSSSTSMASRLARTT